MLQSLPGRASTDRQPVVSLMHLDMKDPPILSYSSITEDKLDLFLQNPICFPFPLLPSHPGHMAAEEKELLSGTCPV